MWHSMPHAAWSHICRLMHCPKDLQHGSIVCPAAAGLSKVRQRCAGNEQHERDHPTRLRGLCGLGQWGIGCERELDWVLVKGWTLVQCRGCAPAERTQQKVQPQGNQTRSFRTGCCCWDHRGAALEEGQSWGFCQDCGPWIPNGRQVPKMFVQSFFADSWFMGFVWTYTYTRPTKTKISPEHPGWFSLAAPSVWSMMGSRKLCLLRWRRRQRKNMHPMRWHLVSSSGLEAGNMQRGQRPTTLWETFQDGGWTSNLPRTPTTWSQSLTSDCLITSSHLISLGKCLGLGSKNRIIFWCKASYFLHLILAGIGVLGLVDHIRSFRSQTSSKCCRTRGKSTSRSRRTFATSRRVAAFCFAVRKLFALPLIQSKKERKRRLGIK